MKTLFRSAWFRRAGIVGLAFFLLVGVLGFLVAPRVLRPYLETLIADKLHRSVHIAELAINPYALSITAKGVAIGERTGGGEMAGFDELYVDVESSSLLHWAPVLNNLTLSGPRLHLVRNADNRYNVTDLIEEFLNKPDTEPRSRYALYNIQVKGGRIDFDDQPLGSRHRVSDLELDIPFVSNLPSQLKAFVQPRFSAKVDGAPLALGGRILPFASDRQAALHLEVTDLDLPRYLDYIPVPLAIHLPSARLDTRLALVFSQQDGKPATIRLSGTASLRQLEAVHEDGRPLLKLQSLKVALKSFEPMAGKLDLDFVSIESPELALSRLKDGGLSLSHLLGHAASPPEPAKVEKAGKGSSLALNLAEFRLEGGRLAFTDYMSVKPVRLSLEGMEGRLSRLSLAEGVPRGRADISLGLKALRVMAEGEKTPAFDLDSLTLAGLADGDRRELLLSDIRAVGGRIAAARETDGHFSLERLLPGPDGKPAPVQARQAGSEPGGGWIVKVQKLSLDGWAARLEDRQEAGRLPLLLNGLDLQAENVSTARGSQASLTLRSGLGRRGRLGLKGVFALEPLQGRFDVDLKGLDLVPLQGYFNQFPNMLLTRGALDGKGRMSFELAAGRPLRAAFRGGLGVGDLSLIDRLNEADLLKWKRLNLSSIDLSVGGKEGPTLGLSEIALSDYYARLVVNADGTLALRKLVTAAPSPSSNPGAGTDASATPAPSGGVPWRLRADRLSLSNGRVNYSDYFIRPNYSANLTGLGGQVTGLSSEAGSTALVDLAGTVDGTAPLKITGKVNPLSRDLYLDLSAAAHGVELAGLSAYSARYAGYALEKGKLSVDIHYFIQNRKLQAENHVFLDQLTFGEKVESPDATKLPVLLAVALLKNGRGEIDVNLPISGSLDDPQFSVGGIVVRMIMNLVVKAVTAPFALIGNLFGGGEELGWLEFDPGHALITPASEEKLKTLSKALIDRPGLRLDIVGRIDPQADLEGYRRVMLERKVRLQKLKETVGKGEDAGALNEVVVSKEEWPKYLTLAYKAESFPKPRNLIGMAKTLPVAEMEKLITDSLSVSGDDLRHLAESRARAAESWLVNKGKVPATRVFVAAPGAGQERKEGGTPARLSRVDFVLK